MVNCTFLVILCQILLLNYLSLSNLVPQKLQSVIHQKRWPDDCLQNSQHAHPETRGYRNIINHRADEAEAIDCFTATLGNINIHHIVI